MTHQMEVAASDRHGPSTIAELRRSYASHDRTVVSHVAEIVEAISQGEPLNAFVVTARDAALREARTQDALLESFGPGFLLDYPLLGTTIAVKDLIDTRALPTRRGSLMQPERWAAVDAPVVARLRRAGAIIVGKTATSESGWSASTLSQVGPPTRNPWNYAVSAGGSSGGSAAAVAAGMCDAALGTDGAGSIRIPAAFCGVVGFKPTFGHVPYVPPCEHSLAHVGPLTRTVEDAETVMSVITGPHPGDPSSTCPPGTQVLDRPLRIGWVEFPTTERPVRAAVAVAAEALGHLGHQVEEILLPFEDPYPALVDLIAASEAASASEQYDAWCDPGRLAVIRYGRSLTMRRIARAEAVRAAVRSRVDSLMTDFDLFAMATVPIEPFAFDAIAPDWASTPPDLRWLAWTPATYPFNLTGQPAISVPCGLTSSWLPAGVQLVGRGGEDSLVLRTARDLEDALGLQLDPARIQGRHG